MTITVQDNITSQISRIKGQDKMAKKKTNNKITEDKGTCDMRWELLSDSEYYWDFVACGPGRESTKLNLAKFLETEQCQ